MEQAILNEHIRDVAPYDSMDDRLGRQPDNMDMHVSSQYIAVPCCRRVMALFDCGLGLQIFPIALTILFPLTFLTSYLIAVLLGHVEPGFPYISDTGTTSPESCIFGQFLNICSVLAGICIYIKYRHVREYYQFGDTAVVRLNKACLVFGIFACLGVSMVANFQETNVISVHIIGANFAFGVGTLYCWVMWYVSHRYMGVMNSKCITICRLLLSITATVAFVMTLVFGSISMKKFHGKDVRKWYPDDGGFVEHVISTASEWVLAGCILLYFASLIPDFRKIGGREPEVYVLVDEEADLLPRLGDPSTTREEFT